MRPPSDRELIAMLPNCRVSSTVTQEEDEAAWLSARTRGIGGSDVGAICGVSPFTSARQVYFSKVGMYGDKLKPNKEAAQRMRFGHLLEPIVADEFKRQYNEYTGKQYNIVELHATMSHKDFPWALANVDRLILDENNKIVGILECKTTSEYMNDEWESGEILESYIYQLNWYMWILDIKFGAFACLVGGNKFYYYEVFRNDELLQKTIIPAAQHFWFENVRKLVEPELQHCDADTEFVNDKYSKAKKDAEIVFDDTTTNELARTVVECKAKIKELDNIMSEAQNRLKDRLKESEIGYTQDYVVKWTPQVQRRVSADFLKANYPEVYEQSLKQITFRKMTIKGA